MDRTAEIRKIDWKAKERKLISPAQRRTGKVLIIIGVLAALAGLFGTLASDWQVSIFSGMTAQVYAARENAISAGTDITGAFDMDGEESGVHIYYAVLEGSDNDVLNVQELEEGTSKKAVKVSKQSVMQFPATKENQVNVIAEDEVLLSNGERVSKAVKFPGAGSSKYHSLKMTTEGACTLTLWVRSSLAGTERKVVLYSTVSGEVDSASAPAPNAEGPLQPVTLTIPKAGTYYLSSKGDIPISLISTIMKYGILLFLAGAVLIFNGIMMHIQRMERMKDLFFVEPVLVFFLLFVYYPVINLIRISFTNMQILSSSGDQTFVGFANYEWLLVKSGSSHFWKSLKVTGLYMFWEVLITLVGGMLLALLFNRMTKMFNTMRAIVFMPKYIAVSTSATVFMWILYSTTSTAIGSSQGILNYALSLFGIQGPDWLIDADTALTGVLFLTAWRVVGYAMMIYLSAMKGIPQDYYEAASIDGADGVQQFRYITVPLLAPTTLFLFVTTFIASMKVFQSVDVMTSGGPNEATNVMVQWIYNLTWSEQQTAHGAAVAVVFFIILLVCTAATMKWSNRRTNYDT